MNNEQEHAQCTWICYSSKKFNSLGLKNFAEADQNANKVIPKMYDARNAMLFDIATK